MRQRGRQTIAAAGVAAMLLAALAIRPAAGQAEAAEAASSQPAPEGAAAPLPTITVIAAGTRHLRDVVRASGRVEPQERVLVQPQIEGQAIEALQAEVGDMVAAGAVLAVLSDKTLLLQKSQLAAARAAAEAGIAQAGAQLTEARAAADEAARVNDRTKALRGQGTASQAQADQAAASAVAAAARVAVATQAGAAARAQLAQAEAQIASVDLQLARTRVTAPVAGRVAARNAMVGAIASAAGQPMFTLIRDDRLELRAELAAADLPRLRPGQKAVLRAVGPGAVAGVVRLVEPELDPASRLGIARISLAAPGGAGQGADLLRAGMFAEAEIDLAERDGLALPVTAVADGIDGPSVMKVVDGIVTRAFVGTGIRDGGWIEITGGLMAGDLVVLKAGAFVREGDRVRPVQPAPVTE